MNPLLIRCFLLFAICSALTACDSNQTTEFALGSMKAKVGGKSWEAVNATANRMTVAGRTTITVAGATLQGEGVSFSITDTGTGTYTLDDTFTPAGPDVLSASYTKSPGQTYIATTGSIRVSRAADSEMEGTFSFETRNQAGEVISVTDGSFNVSLGMSIGG